MNAVIDGAVQKLNDRVGSFDGTAKFEITGEGAIIIDSDGARSATGSEDVDVTLTASRDTFEGMLDGSVNPTMAFMTGKLKVDGDMGAAMRLGGALA